ncbi:unnamed protein product, partial [Iphiclides podalirius]
MSRRGVGKGAWGAWGGPLLGSNKSGANVDEARHQSCGLTAHSVTSCDGGARPADQLSSRVTELFYDSLVPCSRINNLRLEITASRMLTSIN